MKEKFKKLSKVMFLLFVAFFMGNVNALEPYDGNNSKTMVSQGYKEYSPSPSEYVYVVPSDTFRYNTDKGDAQNLEEFGNNIVVKGENRLYPTNTTNIKGLGVEFKASTTSNPVNNEYYDIDLNNDEKSVKFKKLLYINGEAIDVKVTLLSMQSTLCNNIVRVYVNEKFDSNNNLLHRYLGFGTHNDVNGGSCNGTINSTSFYDMVKVKIELFDKNGNAYKDNKLVLYYNDIDGETGTYELLKFYDNNMDNSKVFLASAEGQFLHINNKGIISSTGKDAANAGWDKAETKKVSLVVKGSPLQTSGNLTYGFGHSIVNSSFDPSNERGRSGQNDIQFLAPQSVGGSKTYASDTPAGKNKDMVNVGDTIKYQVTLNPKTSTTDKVTVKLKDTLSKGLTYVTGSAKVGGVASEPTVNNNELVWTIENFNEQVVVTYSVKVGNDYENNKVSNSAVAIIDETEFDLGKTVNPLPSKKYAEDTPSGSDGAKVNKGDVIKYSVVYRNTKEKKEKIKITDTLSKGIKYKKDSAKVGDKALEPKVTENSDGTTTLVWEKEVAADTEEELTYSVDVIGGVSEVRNKAYLQYAELKDGSDTEYGEYSEKIKLNELVNPLDVVVPNTGVSTSIVFIIVGLLLIGSGIVVIKKNAKKSLN